MRIAQLVGAAILACASSSLAEQLPFDHILWGEKGPAGNGLVKRQATTTTAATSTTSRVADAACTNGPLTRSCWASGFSIATDFDAKWPSTGRTVSYTLEVTNTTCNPDGSGARTCLLLNNQFPGPTITANWGDMISITLINSMKDNGTGIHWHGLRMLNAVSMDGTSGVTECPLAPGDRKTYLFQATQFGTSWYHSHYSAQYGDGMLGAVVINGPAPANYDIDLGPLVLGDWYYKTAYQVAAIAHQNLQAFRGAPVPDTLLINGTNKSPTGTGSYNKITLTRGKKYRLRLINTSVDSNMRVSLDNHPFLVMTADFVPVKPYTANWILLGIGQRYDVVITANNTAGNYWFRADAANECASGNNFYGRSIFSYVGADNSDPTSVAATKPAGCADEGPLTPYVSNVVPKDTFVNQAKNLNVDLQIDQVTTNGQNIVIWGVNLTAINVDWRKPSLQYVKEGNTNYPSAYNLLEIPNGQTWTYWIIQETNGTAVPIPHPMHLHGHDFYILGSGTGVFNKDTDVASLKFDNPMRRDVTFLPGRGWVVIAFPTDNPGTWLMHCHIAWHIGEGLGVQFLESKGSIPLPGADWDSTCAKWNTYYNGSPAYNQSDSGL